MSKVEIWHNPTCTKSKQVLFMLQDKGFDVDVRDILSDPPTIYQLQTALRKLDLDAIEITRVNEPRFRQLGLTPQTDDNTLIAAMSAHTMLLQRPIVFCGDKAALGRPLENVLDILP